MKPVIQQEKSGCAIASSAAIAGLSYSVVKKMASELNINANDPSLWSSPKPIRKILHKLGIKAGAEEINFNNWTDLPDCALLAIKWHIEKGLPYWHWVVFVRGKNHCYILDSKKSLANNIRTDFGRIKPKWFIKIYQ